MDNNKSNSSKFIKILWVLLLALFFILPDCFIKLRNNIIHKRLVDFNLQTLEYIEKHSDELKKSQTEKKDDVSDSGSVTVVTTTKVPKKTTVTVLTTVPAATTVPETTVVTTETTLETLAEAQPDPPQSEAEYIEPVYVPEVHEEPEPQYVEPVNEPQPQQPPVQNTSGSYEQSEILRLINEIRASHGLQTFGTTDQLNAAASQRAEETTRSFSHTRPDGRSCFSVVEDYGIQAMAMGENIACGNSSPERTVDQWMNSEAHRNNILNPAYTMMGVGFSRASDQYGFYWTQLFVG